MEAIMINDQEFFDNIPAQFKHLYVTSLTNPCIKIPDPILRKRAEEISNESPEELNKIALELWKAFSYGFVGMSAPQVGFSKRMIIVGPRGHAPELMINPVITSALNTQYCEEGCGSCPALWGNVERHKTIEVEALNMNLEVVKYCFDGFGAVVAQHEISHLNGELFTDLAIKGTLRWRTIDGWKAFEKKEEGN